MKISTFFEIVVIVLLAGWMLLPFYSRRIRAPWAKLICVACGLIGIAQHLVSLIVERHQPPYNSDTIYGIYAMHNSVDGLLLGFFLSLVLSGQLAGQAYKAGDKP